MRTWRCHGCGRTVRVSYDELAGAGRPVCGRPDCPNAGDRMELLPEPAPRRTEVHLVIPCKENQVEDVAGALDKDGHILCRSLGRRKDDYRVVVNPPRPRLHLPDNRPHDANRKGRTGVPKGRPSFYGFAPGISRCAARPGCLAPIYTAEPSLQTVSMSQGQIVTPMDIPSVGARKGEKCNPRSRS